MLVYADHTMKLCLIEDDLELGRGLHAALRDAGHEVLWLRRAQDGAHWLANDEFDAILLDLSLPDGDGMHLLKEARSKGIVSPILLISAREGLQDRLKGLDLGADDYLVKPFATAELLARIRAVARRGRALDEASESVLQVRDLTVNEQQRLVHKDGQNIQLSPTEFALLYALIRRPNRVLTRGELEAAALRESEGQSLDVHMSNLRKKIGEGYIRTVRGVGYGIQN